MSSEEEEISEVGGSGIFEDEYSAEDEYSYKDEELSKPIGTLPLLLQAKTTKPAKKTNQHLHFINASYYFNIVIL